MQFIVVFHPKDKSRTEGPPANFAQVEQAEQVQAKALYKSGGIRQSWALEKEGKGAIGLFEAASQEKADIDGCKFPDGPEGLCRSRGVSAGPVRAVFGMIFGSLKLARGQQDAGYVGLLRLGLR